MALITKNWQQFPAADDYHACTSMKVSSNSGGKKGSEKWVRVKINGSLILL
jgi:hypothetical protein